MSAVPQIESIAEKYQTVVGMEVHAQLLTRTKMFCRCSADYQGAPPNTHTCPTCLGLPGAMPVINQAAVEATIKTGLALNCQISKTAVFARKNYHYPDLPKGYQISQYELPLCEHGWVEIDLPDGGIKRIGIRRAHLEEDTGKNIHEGNYTLVDLNRAGMPLMEIVTEADIASPEEAYAFLTKLRTILRYLGVNSGDMEKGAMRCEPNISIRTQEQAQRGEYGTKVEVKNLNSFRAVRNAIAYETARQAEVIERGGKVQQVNMGWDENQQRTVLQRSKESSEDYRYFPEPDLPPLFMIETWVDEIRASLPELPEARRNRYESWGVRRVDAEILTSERQVAEFYEAAVDAYGQDGDEPQRMANWFIAELFRHIYAAGDAQDLRQIAALPVKPTQMAALLRLVDEKTINANTAKKVLEIMSQTGDDPKVVVGREGWAMVSDTSVIDDAIAAILANYPGELARYKSGEDKLFGFFMGQVMRNMSGQADPQMLRQRLQALLSDPST
jgi:aspartyl-tRNA(Asn)/glutamyl-tRNA(Gln) amidotransferase subunit B